MDPAALIRAVRRRHGLTQADLARRAGTSQPVVSVYERGQRDPTFETLRRLVEAAGERLDLRAAPVPNGIEPPADDHERARRLLDVLSVADAIPVRPQATRLRAPRLISQ